MASEDIEDSHRRHQDSDDGGGGGGGGDQVDRRGGQHKIVRWRKQHYRKERKPPQGQIALLEVPAHSPQAVVSPLKPIRSFEADMDEQATSTSHQKDQGSSSPIKGLEDNKNETSSNRDAFSKKEGASRQGKSDPDGPSRSSLYKDDDSAYKRGLVESQSTPLDDDHGHEEAFNERTVSWYDGMADSDISHDGASSIRAIKSPYAPRLRVQRIEN